MRILFFIHSLPPHEFSGSPLTAYCYAQSFGKLGFGVGVVYPAFTDTEFSHFKKLVDEQGFVRYEVPFTENTWQLWSIYDACYMDNRRREKEKILTDILNDFHPDIIHVIDSVNLPSEWTTVAKQQYGLPIIRQVLNTEDICGRIAAFIDESLSVCYHPITVERCTECCYRLLKDQGGFTVEKEELSQALSRKKAFCEQQYTNIYDLIIFSINSFKDFYLQKVNIPKNKIAVVERGISHTSPRLQSSIDRKKVRFVFLGALSVLKGITLLRDVFLSQELLDRDDYELYLYGPGDPDAVAEVVNNNRNVSYIGGYQPQDLPDILAQADVGLSPSYFETFHTVTREYLVCGIPVVGSTVFGIPEIVRDGVNGLVFNAGDKDTFKAKILSLLDDRDLLNILKENALKTRVTGLKEEIEELIDIYYKLVRRSKIQKGRTFGKMFEFTGERFLPWMEGAHMHYEHLQRRLQIC